MEPQFECRICGERSDSKAMWLFHLILNRHSLKARENFKFWLREKKQIGDIYVITGLDQVDTSMLLEFVSGNLQSFSDVVFFTPQADICTIVCDRREFSIFSSKPLPDHFRLLKFKHYDDVTKDEWASFFKVRDQFEGVAVGASRINSVATASNLKRKQEELDDQQIKLQKVDPSFQQRGRAYPSTSYVRTDTNESHSSKAANTSQNVDCNNEWSTSSRRNFQGPTRPSGMEDEWESSSHSQLKKQEKAHSLDDNNQNDRSNRSPTLSGVVGDWHTDLERIYNIVMLPKSVRELRKKFLTYLKDFLRRKFPSCEIIPVGADFLDFDIESTYFTVYFDSKGVTNPAISGPSCDISELLIDSDKVRSPLQQTLKILERDGKLTDLACEGADKIKFNFVFYGIKCRILLKPFMLAQTARLCKQFYFMNSQVPYLLILVTYWAMQHSGFTARGSCNPFIFNWLVYFFLMLKGSLPRVSDLQRRSDVSIIDREMEVAFKYDESRFSDDVETYMFKKENTRSIVETLLEWFIFIDDTFGETATKGVNRRHSLVCPRYAELIDKRKFKVCAEYFLPKKNTLTSEQKQVRKLWRDDLVNIGFDESCWHLLKTLQLPDTLSIQHPLYITENIGKNFDGPFSKFFFSNVKKTRAKLSKLIEENNTSASLMMALH